MSSVIFFKGENAKIFSKNYTIINDEIKFIQDGILSAVKNFKFSKKINNTYMTTPGTSASSYYYNVWLKNIEDDQAEDQILTIIKYFTDMNYNINIITNTSSLNSFIWSLKW